MHRSALHWLDMPLSTQNSAVCSEQVLSVMNISKRLTGVHEHLNRTKYHFVETVFNSFIVFLLLKIQEGGQFRHKVNCSSLTTDRMLPKSVRGILFPAEAPSSEYWPPVYPGDPDLELC